MVVEDDFQLASEMADYLRTRGARMVGPFSTLARGLEAWIASGSLHFAVLDIGLRDEKVYGLAHVLMDRGVRVVFVTGYDQLMLPAYFQQCPHLPKPVDFRALDRALQSQIAT